ncbi:MAG: hypothetical protein Q9O62_04425 [Ardenticatenia bacterium]|nr:hypothetical protein [Ardenticatenia bacterium]
MAREGNNPFVSYLNRYTTASPDHEAAFDEFITHAPPSGEPLRLETRTERFVHACFRRQRPPSVILTGNAGDGKTYLCRRIVEAFTGQPVTEWADRLDWPIERDGLTLRVVKDLSEVGEERAADLLYELALDQLEEQPRFAFLIAANEGRLRAVLQRERLEELYAEVDRQLREGPNLENDRLVVLNLNQATTSTYVPQALAWLTDPVHWEACAGCPALNACPIRFNAGRLRDEHIARRVQRLYQVLEHLGIHVTIRDMLIHLAYTLTGGLRCETVIEKSRHIGWEVHRYVYYENVWGEMADETFRRKAVVIRHLRRLNVGETSVFEVDDYIINGQPDDRDAQAEHERLFAPALDLGGRRFEQDRAAYLHGGASSPKPEEEHPLMAWLPHCRRKLFFEWQNGEVPDRLFPFLYLPDYFRLLHGDRALLDRYRRDLILGLNRAFSGLYLTDADHLYVTSQYAHAVEQPVPLVRVKIAADYVDLRPDTERSEAFDRDLTTLLLEIPPPPRVRAEPVRWRVDLLRFEYLMRRARGGTPNILAAECELAIRQLKDERLARFAAEETDPNRVLFFAADRNRYALQTLWVDEEGRIRV